MEYIDAEHGAAEHTVEHQDQQHEHEHHENPNEHHYLHWDSQSQHGGHHPDKAEEDTIKTTTHGHIFWPSWIDRSMSEPGPESPPIEEEHPRPPKQHIIGACPPTRQRFFSWDETMSGQENGGGPEWSEMGPKEEKPNIIVQIGKDIIAYKTILLIIFIPIIGLPICLQGSSEARCAYVVLVMGAYWMFEVMPLSVTALIPTFAFPILSILSASATCSKYLSQINFLFIGGLIMALAVEKCNLHERVALRVMTVVGSEPKWIMLGFMSVTAFLSMWMSNTATTAMMVPIAQSVVLQLVSQKAVVRRQQKEPLTRRLSRMVSRIIPIGSEPRSNVSTINETSPPPPPPPSSSEAKSSGSPQPAMSGKKQLKPSAFEQEKEKAQNGARLQDLERQESVGLDELLELTAPDAEDAEPTEPDPATDDGMRRMLSRHTSVAGQRRNEQRRLKHSRSVHESLVHPASADQAASDLDLDTLDDSDRKMAKGLLISIAFAANIGGTGTITGTPPNLVLVNQFDGRYPKAVGLVSFLVWMQFAIPLVIIAVIVCWLLLALMFLNAKDILNTINPLACFKRYKAKKARTPEQVEADKAHVDPVTAMIRRRYTNLPPMSFAEISVLILFLLLLALWIFRDPKVIPGFGSIFRPKYYADSTSAMLISVILFIFPDQKPDWICFRSRQQTKPIIRGALMDWATMQHKFPWSIVLLLGGGFALAEGVNKSGLSAAIGDALRALEDLDIVWLQLCCVVATMMVTNICSNTVTAVIFLQIVAQMAEKLQYHPLLFMLPTTLSCSYAFLLPVATPPNAIVFASGLITVGDMMKVGGVITLVAIVLIMAYMHTWATLFWAFGTFPAWANVGTTTVATTLATTTTTAAAANATTTVARLLM